MPQKEKSRTNFKDYLVVNIIFILFCAAQLLFIKIFIKELAGVLFFFVVLVIGFVFVSAFDSIYDRLSERAAQGKAKGNPPEAEQNCKRQNCEP